MAVAGVRTAVESDWTADAHHPKDLHARRSLACNASVRQMNDIRTPFRNKKRNTSGAARYHSHLGSARHPEYKEHTYTYRPQSSNFKEEHSDSDIEAWTPSQAPTPGEHRIQDIHLRRAQRVTACRGYADRRFEDVWMRSHERRRRWESIEACLVRVASASRGKEPTPVRSSVVEIMRWGPQGASTGGLSANDGDDMQWGKPHVIRTLNISTVRRRNMVSATRISPFKAGSKVMGIQRPLWTVDSCGKAVKMTVKLGRLNSLGPVRRSLRFGICQSHDKGEAGFSQFRRGIDSIMSSIPKHDDQALEDVVLTSAGEILLMTPYDRRDDHDRASSPPTSTMSQGDAYSGKSPAAERQLQRLAWAMDAFVALASEGWNLISAFILRSHMTHYVGLDVAMLATIMLTYSWAAVGPTNEIRYHLRARAHPAATRPCIRTDKRLRGSEPNAILNALGRRCLRPTLHPAKNMVFPDQQHITELWTHLAQAEACMREAHNESGTELLQCKAPGRDVDNITVVEYDRVKEIDIQILQGLGEPCTHKGAEVPPIALGRRIVVKGKVQYTEWADQICKEDDGITSVSSQAEPNVVREDQRHTRQRAVTLHHLLSDRAAPVWSGVVRSRSNREGDRVGNAHDNATRHLSVTTSFRRSSKIGNMSKPPAEEVWSTWQRGSFSALEVHARRESERKPSSLSRDDLKKPMVTTALRGMADNCRDLVKQLPMRR
ncbi:hypothetical protein BKA93DRAFT_751837 [Sparassis latifolia]